MQLVEGETNKFKVEVTAEDGTVKFYHVNITRMSASTAALKSLQVGGTLQPQFEAGCFEYSGFVIILSNVVKTCRRFVIEVVQTTKVVHFILM